MSGSEGEHQKKVASPGRGAGVRSASPAKRSAADMEGEQREARQSVPGSFTQENGDGPTHFDEAMGGMTPGRTGDTDTQDTVENSVQTSAQDSMATANTVATSFQSENPPPYSAKNNSGTNANMEIPSIDEQERMVRQLSQDTIDEGQLGFVVSHKWLARVLARSSDGLKNTNYPKEAREGDIGPIDNSDVVPEGTFDRPDKIITDANKKAYVPLKPGLVPGEDYELLPERAWGQVLSWYGLAKGQKQIVRYVHNTAPAEATTSNFQYELYPPVFTIRKVPQPTQGERKTSPKTSYDELRKRKERDARGQLSPDDAFRLVSSRSEKFQNFLKRAKEAAEIPFATKVKIWRTSKASNAVAKGNPTGVMSPPQSRSSSPNADPPPKLIIDSASFNKMEECELIDGKDETGNQNYNGSSTMDMYQLFEDSTLVLEEQIGGPAGGEFGSDKKPKHTIKIGIPGRSTGSKAPSAAPSRGASPAPGGMMTRGRQRRDGRTRGTVGLSNLGNTCYMNSALQCIRSVEELAIYFLSDKYKPEINTSNPLGHGGVMAKQYATLLNNIYGENAGGSFTPSAFKKTLGSMQPLFSGYGQQDSQEFLSFLVDALHEDLNRIIKKPYNENPDSDDSTVRDPQAIIKLGDIYRANHRARNQSIAMDLFNGFYKNTMECPNCDKISITFDPFSLVTVQLPMESTFSHTYVFVPLSGKPVKHDIDMDKISKHGNGEEEQPEGNVEKEDDRPIPSDFMDPSFVLNPALRNHLFLMKYAKAQDGMYCTGMSSVNDRSITQMSDRVKEPARRGSADSSTSDDESTTSTGSNAAANGEQEVGDSDDEFDDKPDITIGEVKEDSLGLPTPVGQNSDSEELPEDPIVGQKPGARRGQKQRRGKNKGRGRGQKTYGKKGRRNQQNQTNGAGRFNTGGKFSSKDEDDNDNPYYVKLGEGIVLDWYPDALNNLFGGDPKSEDDERGHFSSSSDGKELDIFPDPVIQEKRAKRTLRKKQGITLDECFVETGKREVLSEDNAWYCGNCKELRRAAKTLEIWTIPDILVVHLKRFGGTRSFKDKLDVLVDYPIQGLDMTDRIGLKEEGKEYVYDLFAVDNHYGGLGGGHYTAYAKNFYDGEWYDYNDASCSKLSERTLQNNAAAYLLFYRRRSPTPLGPDYLKDLVTEARNPTSSTDAPTNDETAEESDAGEGRLGGPNGSLRGSSGGWTGAGAGASSAPQAQTTGSGGTSGARQGAVSSLTTKTETNEDGKVFYGPQRPPHMQYGEQGSNGWSFGGIDENDDNASDAGSMAANADRDDDGDALMNDIPPLDPSPPDLEAAGDPFGSAAGAGTPNTMWDDHTLYSGGRYDFGDDVLHLEDAGGMGGDVESNSTDELRSPSGDVEDERLKVD